MGDRLESAQGVKSTPDSPESAKQEPQHHVVTRRSRVVAALVALGLFGAGGYLAWIAFTPTGNPRPAAPGPGDVHRIRVDGPPQPTAAGEGAVWTAVGTSDTEDLLWRIDAITEKPQVLPNTRGSGWPAVGEGFAWVTCTGKDNPCSGPSVLKLDPRSGKTLATISLPEHPFGIATGLGAVWVAMYEGLAKLDPVEERVTAVFEGNYSGIGTAGGSVWATSMDPDRVYRIDPTTGAVLTSLDRRSACTFDASGDVVWVATCDAEIRSDGGQETLAKIDAHTAEVVLQAPLASYGQMRMAGGSLWVASQVERRSDLIEVIRLDPETGKVAGEPIRIATGPLRFFAHGDGLPHVFVAADQDSLWLTDFGAGEVIRLMLPPTEALTASVVESSTLPTQTETTSPTPYLPAPSSEPASGADAVSVSEAILEASYIEGLPQGFPSSFPFPQGTTSCGAHAIEEQGGKLFETCFRVSAIYNEVVAFYRRNLPEKGWTLGPIPHGAEGSRIAAFEVAGHGFVGRLEVVEEPGRVTLYVELES